MGSDPTDEELLQEAGAALRLLQEPASGGVSRSRVARAAKLGRFATRAAAGWGADRLRRVLGRPEALLELARRTQAQELTRGLGELKGLAMKLGQMASYIDHSVPESMREVFAWLQTQSPRTPFDQIVAIINAELAPRGMAAFAELDPEPVASASIGQVHRGRLPDGTEVAVKVQHPGIEDAIRADLGNVRMLSRVQALILPHANVRGLAEEMRARFLEECDYRLEAQRQQRFFAMFEHHPSVRVPRVFPACSSRRVLTSAFHRGRSFAAYLDSQPSAAQRTRVGEALCRFYIGSVYLDGVFNADPHPGNYIFADDGGVVVLDYGCVREFTPAYVARLAALLRAVMADDPVRIHAAIVDLGILGEDTRYDRDGARTLLRWIYEPLLEPGPKRLTPSYTQQAYARFVKNPNFLKFSLPSEMLFLNRLNFGLMSIMVDLDAEIDWQRLIRAFLEGRDPTRDASAPGEIA